MKTTKRSKQHTQQDAFRLGFKQSKGDWGMTYDDSSMSPRSRAYDYGRTIGELPDCMRRHVFKACDKQWFDAAGNSAVFSGL